MNPISLELSKARLIGGLILLAIALAAAGAAGWLVNGWRLDGDHQRALAAKDAAYNELASHSQAQNAAVQALGIERQAADDRGKLAMQYADRFARQLGDRAAAVRNSQEKDCAGVLREAWGAK